MSKQVIVIGAGPGGLAAAMLLANAGLKVTVLERASQVGGRTTTIEGDGFRFDAGPTFFLYPEVLNGIFASVGRDLMREVPMTRLDPQYRIIFGGGGEIRATPDMARMQEQIANISPADAPAFQRFMDVTREKLRLFKPCLENPFLRLRDVCTTRMLKLLPLLRPHRSLDWELGRYFTDPRIRLAFSFQSKYLGMSPFRCPSLFSILSFIEYEYGIFHPTGGCGAITQAMARICREMGVDIQLGQDVQEVLVEKRRTVGVRLKDREIRCDALVVNADFARAMSRLVPGKLRKRWSDKRLAGKKYSCSTYMMYLGIEGRCDHLDHHNIFISDAYKRNMHEIEHAHLLSDDPSFYVANPSVTDDTMAPKGMSALYVLVPVSNMHPNIDWPTRSAAFRQTVLKQLKLLGLDDVERRIRFERVCTPADWQDKFEIYRGATFSLAHNLGQMLHKRPPNRFDELDNTYLVGGGTHPGSGLPVIFESAKISTRLLLEDIA